MKNALRVVVVVVLSAGLALSGFGKTKVLFYADTEDYTCDYSNDGIRDVARTFEKEGIKCCFNITGYLALRILELGRQDVIDALKSQTIGIQTLYHTRHPTPAEVADDPDYERAYRRALRDEAMAYGMVEAVFGEGRTVFTCPCGYSISAQMMEAHHDLGFVFGAGNGYVGSRYGRNGLQIARPGTEVDGLWYFNLYQASYTGCFDADSLIPGYGMIPEGCSECPDFGPVLDDFAKFDFVGIGSHPNMPGHKVFWDKVNYDKRNLVPWRHWIEAPRRDPKDTDQFYRNLTAFIRAVKADSRFQITNFDEMIKGVRPRHPIKHADLPAVRAALEKDFNCIREPASWCVSDVFLAVVKFLRGESSHVPGKVYGFLQRPKGVTSPTTVTAAGLRAAAAKIDLGTFLPPQIEVDGKKIGPADFLYAALEVLTEGKDSVTIMPREQLGSFKEIPALENLSLRGTWLHSDDFRDDFVSERLRLQLWTLRIDPCEYPAEGELSKTGGPKRKQVSARSAR